MPCTQNSTQMQLTAKTLGTVVRVFMHALAEWKKQFAQEKSRWMQDLAWGLQFGNPWINQGNDAEEAGEVTIVCSTRVWFFFHHLFGEHTKQYCEQAQFLPDSSYTICLTTIVVLLMW